jgi:recombination protein RecT
MPTQQMIKREDEAKVILKDKIKQIELLTGDKQKASKFGSALVQLSQNNNLKDCSVQSILDVGFQIVQAGLNPNPLFGHAYVVPFKIKGKDGKPDFTVAQLQVGYKGYIQLGYRSGWRFKAVPVYKCDEFDYKFGGFEDEILLEPNYEKRNEDSGDWVFKNMIGVIIYAKDKHDYISTEFVPFKKLEQLRQKSQNQVKGKLQYIWLEWAEEMYCAKALKHVVTRLPIEDEVKEMIISENQPFTIDAKPIEDKKPTNDINSIG